MSAMTDTVWQLAASLAVFAFERSHRIDYCPPCAAWHYVGAHTHQTTDATPHRRAVAISCQRSSLESR